MANQDRNWTSEEIRTAFLEFFKSKQHQIVPSAPMVVKDDPTLMFTNAGMNQFKDLFLGNKPVVYPRIANTQKCLRVSGKHNDLEEVGVDTYHHTMFEMLGNWSFGDYFKKDAISWAWELLTEVYKIDKSRLYVTVFEGSTDDKLGFDQEAYDYWKQFISEDRILKGNKKDNFWEMGDTGPCGPCSEIHCDIRTDEERAKIDGKALVNASHPQVIEIWNNVFMEFNRNADGSLVKLPAQHVDTGMGFERLCVVLQGKQSNYDTDNFQYMIRELEKMTGRLYGKEEKTDIAMRVISDHIRAIAFSIADGQLPSNTGAGYVIRRILRRAVRYGYSFLDLKEAFICKLVPSMVNKLGGFFPELKSQENLIINVIKEEEESFLRTLENGIDKFNKHNDPVITGEFAFELYDTFGFPIDLTQLLARENGKTVDMDAFNACLNRQKERSRQAGAVETGDWVVLSEQNEETFVGYDTLSCESHITKYRKVKSKGKELYQLVLDRTPFYAESGGQVGDVGTLLAEGKSVAVVDTKKENNLIIHFTTELPTNPSATFIAQVDSEKRHLTANNHSATHLLHHALRTILGNHVEQKGSLVNPDYLRFDFSHFQKLTAEQITAVERLVNAAIRKNDSLNESRQVPIAEAKQMGAMALFGEKYGDSVRVIRFAESVELCGGTHVPATGQIGLFKIISESAIAAGIRRIEAITSVAAEAFIDEKLTENEQIREALKNPKNPIKAVQDLQAEIAELTRKVEALNREKAESLKDEFIKNATEINGVKLIARRLDLEAGATKDLAFQLKSMDNYLLVFGSEANGKASLTVAVSDNLVNERKLHAGNIVRELAKEIQGGGGGQAFYATAGGTNGAGLEKAFSRAKEFLS